MPGQITTREPCANGIDMTRWIFLRGLMRESGHWGAFDNQFSEANQPCNLHLLDLPGNGALFKQTSPANVAAMVESYRAQLDALGIQPPYHLMAMSLGGMVATAWAAAYPREVAGMVLINTSMRPFSPFYHRLQARAWPRLLELALSGGTALQWESSIWRLTSALSGASVIEDWLALRRAHPVSRTNTLRQLVAAARFRAPPSMKTPTLVLCASQDRLVAVQCSLAISAAWQCPLKVHPSAGHDLPLDDGAWVTEQIAQWQAGHR